ncbi:MAG: tRNA (adenosine(37)-N6)-dimethylallyltransferase MiaA [Thermomicrobia bacterium]|nr:tRNA (adenosine(37)-N6)-dimethylallyltransferase MiaA [Thermomicrobia bacterium]
MSYASTDHVKRQPLIALLGPTGAGKSALALALAAAFSGEIVSADSRLLYRGMDIGTAKPTPEERTQVPHHLIDVVTPDVTYDLARWKAEATAIIADVHGRDHLPFLVGGTAQWTTALLDGWEPPTVAPDPQFRAAMEERARSEGIAPLLAELRARDPEAAARTGPNLRRIIRALEVIRATGQPFSALRGRSEQPYRTLRIGLSLPRDVLYARIDARVVAMLAAGLVDEVCALFDAGYDSSLPALSGIGYRQVAEYLRGETTFNIMCDRIAQATHRYARHQMTWLRRDAAIIWLHADDERRLISEATAMIGRFLLN